LNRRTDPLQLIKDPIVLASRQLRPAKYLAVMVHPPNFPTNARTQMAMVYAHVMPGRANIGYINIEGIMQLPDDLPSLRRPKSVERPDKVKYCPN
jgi:hypothetical protein